MRALLDIVLLLLNFYQIILIGAAVMSWLIAFNVANPRNPMIGQIYLLTRRLTEPFLQPLRRYVPSFGGLDMAFLVLFLLTILIDRMIVYYIYPNVF